MILKSFELNKLKLENYNFYLFYGDNEGLKEDTIKSFFVKKYQNKIHRYEEKEILDNIDDFYNALDNINTNHPDIDSIIHAAATKRIDAVEDNILYAVDTNIY